MDPLNLLGRSFQNDQTLVVLFVWTEAGSLSMSPNITRTIFLPQNSSRLTNLHLPPNTHQKGVNGPLYPLGSHFHNFPFPTAFRAKPRSQMHYLELDLELLDDVPTELKHKCCEMRHLDFRVEKARSEVRKKSIEFFNIRNTLTQEEREIRIARIHQSYHQIRKLSEDKIAIAEHLHLMLEKYHERISRHLSEFEYESDTPGD
ncbi:inhibitor of growth protein 3 [Ditylenchus destructor]|uniref:Inhibitor of growth protein 3 n=1 Tax=Ditylenchus destructor TaxID=166010 RepID=A0AAD4MGP4_9BILA|nr:inhibitor of growth protein 3 [Ditylenchus destructor]